MIDFNKIKELMDFFSYSLTNQDQTATKINNPMNGTIGSGEYIVNYSISHSNNLSDEIKENLILANKTNVELNLDFNKNVVKNITICFGDKEDEFVPAVNNTLSYENLEQKENISISYCPSNAGTIFFHLIVEMADSDSTFIIETIRVYPNAVSYYKPYLSNIDVYRCDNNGMKDEKNGEYVHIEFTDNHMNAIEYTCDGENILSENNITSVSCSITESKGGSNTFILNSDSVSDSNVLFNSYTNNDLPRFNTKHKLTVSLKITDEFNEDNEYTFVLECGNIGLHLSDDYKAIGIGESARDEDGTVSVGYKTYFDKESVFKNQTKFEEKTKFINGIQPVKLFDITDRLDSDSFWGEYGSNASYYNNQISAGWDINFVTQDNRSTSSFQKYLLSQHFSKEERAEFRNDISSIGKFNILLCEIAAVRTTHGKNSKLEVAVVPAFRHLGKSGITKGNKSWSYANDVSPMPLENVGNLISFSGGASSAFDLQQAMTWGINIYVLCQENSEDPFINKESDGISPSNDVIIMGQDTVHSLSPYTYDGDTRYHTHMGKYDNPSTIKILSIYGIM